MAVISDVCLEVGSTVRAKSKDTVNQRWYASLHTCCVQKALVRVTFQNGDVRRGEAEYLGRGVNRDAYSCVVQRAYSRAP